MVVLDKNRNGLLTPPRVLILIFFSTSLKEHFQTKKNRFQMVDSGRKSGPKGSMRHFSYTYICHIKQYSFLKE